METLHSIREGALTFWRSSARATATDVPIFLSCHSPPRLRHPLVDDSARVRRRECDPVGVRHRLPDSVPARERVRAGPVLPARPGRRQRDRSGGHGREQRLDNVPWLNSR